MKLFNEVKDKLEEEKGFDFSDEMWTGEMLAFIYDIVYTTERLVKESLETTK